MALPVLGIAALGYFAILYWNEVSAERKAAPKDKDIYAKVGILFAVHGLGLALESLVVSLPFSLILLLVAYAWWEANKSILAPVVGAIGGSLAIWQIVRWVNRSRANRRPPHPDPESPAELD
jgi:uncharacterized membrane protein YdjX (TVP38/TMEM64 family)